MKVLHITNSIDKSVGGPSRSVPQTCIELAVGSFNRTGYTRIVLIK
jgi:hypothetical protein